MAQSFLNVRMDADLKSQFAELCDEVGMTTSTAVILFAKAFVRERRLPFEVKAATPNETTIAAIEEGERMLRDPAARRFSSVDELFDDLNT